MRFGALGIALALALVPCAACKTADRLWRISPFEGGSSERVNLWPIAYHDGDATSVLWPLFDVDERGFALRPLIAKDENAYSLLFPLGAYDADAGEGWLVPFYRLGDNAGLFPLANFGNWSWVGPVWWHEGASGLFPVAAFGRTSYVGPVWWRDAEAGAQGGLFPLAMLGDTSYVGPVWWTQGGFGVFPLYGRDLFGSGITHVGPFWWRSGEGEGYRGGLFPLFAAGEDWNRLAVLPLYWHHLSPGKSSRSWLLGLGHSERSEDHAQSWIVPLYYHRAEPERSDTVLLPFFWKRTRGDDARVYTLLGNRAVSADSETLNLYPLWWSNQGPDSSWKMLFPFFYFEQSGAERTLLTPLGGRGWSTDGERAFVNVLGPIYHHSESTRRDESLTAFLWPLYERRRKGEERTTRVAGLWGRETSPEESTTSWLFGLGRAHRGPEGRSRRLWPLYSWADEPDPGLLDDLTLAGRRTGEGSRESWLFPLYSSQSSDTSTNWNALLGIVHGERHGTDEASGSRWWAWPLVSRSEGAGRPGFADVSTLWGSTRWDGGRHVQLGASLLYTRREEEGPARASSSSRALIVFSHDSAVERGAHVPAPGGLVAPNRVQSESRGFLFDAFLSERETYHVWKPDTVGAEEARVLRAYAQTGSGAAVSDRAAALAALEAHGVVPPSEEPAAVRAAIEELAQANGRTVERRHVRLPLLFGYERADDELSWSAPLGLARYERDAESSRFSLLYYAYRSVHEGERTRRDLFPFVTWDSGPDETRFSFLWRLFRYERRGESRGGYVLFFPWGDA